MPRFSGPILLITLGTRDADPEATFWATGRSEEPSRQLSFELFDPYDTASQFFERQTTFLGAIEGRPAVDNFL
jgi:hypothetical protein